MNQPNLQAILSDLTEQVITDQPHGLNSFEYGKEAIDAIYAGLLAVIGEDELPHVGDMKYANQTRAKQRDALKRWCYGDDKEKQS